MVAAPHMLGVAKKAEEHGPHDDADKREDHAAPPKLYKNDRGLSRCGTSVFAEIDRTRSGMLTDVPKENMERTCSSHAAKTSLW